jgi:hypothetical protein
MSADAAIVKTQMENKKGREFGKIFYLHKNFGEF